MGKNLKTNNENDMADLQDKYIPISILYFDLGKGADYLYHGRNQFIGVHTHDYLQISTRKKNALVTRYPSEIFPEYILIRVNEFNQVAVSLLEEWMSYLKDGKIGPDTTAHCFLFVRNGATG